MLLIKKVTDAVVFFIHLTILILNFYGVLKQIRRWRPTSRNIQHNVSNTYT